MRCSKSLTVLSVAVVLGALGVASASARDGGHRDDRGGIQIGPQGQVFGSPSYNASEARAQASSKRMSIQATSERKPIQTSGAAAAAYGSTVKPEPLSVNDPGWHHSYQSWCDVGMCR